AVTVGAAPPVKPTLATAGMTPTLARKIGADTAPVQGGRPAPAAPGPAVANFLGRKPLLRNPPPVSMAEAPAAGAAEPGAAGGAAGGGAPEARAEGGPRRHRGATGRRRAWQGRRSDADDPAEQSIGGGGGPGRQARQAGQEPAGGGDGPGRQAGRPESGG